LKNSGRTIGVSGGTLGEHAPTKFLEHIVILYFETQHPKQNSVIRLKRNILDPPIFWPPPHFGLYTLLGRANWHRYGVRHGCMHARGPIFSKLWGRTYFLKTL